MGCGGSDPPVHRDVVAVIADLQANPEVEDRYTRVLADIACWEPRPCPDDWERVVAAVVPERPVANGWRWFT